MQAGKPQPVNALLQVAAIQKTVPAIKPTHSHAGRKVYAMVLPKWHQGNDHWGAPLMPVQGKPAPTDARSQGIGVAVANNTQGLGVQGGVSLLGGGASYQSLLAWDDAGNAAFVGSWSTGTSSDLFGGSLGAVYQATNAQTVYDLGGESTFMSLQIGPLTGSYISGSSNGAPYSGFEVQLGNSLSLPFALPSWTPLVGVSNSQVIDFSGFTPMFDTSSYYNLYGVP